jgi:hypothetical protein
MGRDADVVDQVIWVDADGGRDTTNVRKLAPLDNRVHRCWADSQTRGDVAHRQEVLGKHQAANASERRSAHGFLTA